MKNILYILSFLCVVATGKAQDTNSAKELLNTVSQKVRSYDNVTIQFTYKMRNIQANTGQETRGKVYLKGEKYRLNLMGVTRLFDGKKLYTISNEDQEITISSYDPKSENTFALSKMLLFYENGYAYSLDILQNIHGRRIQYVKLTPTDSASEVKHILLGIDKQTKNIYKLIIERNDQTQITVEMTSFKPNQPLSQTLFSFQESNYKDYYINRLD